MATTTNYSWTTPDDTALVKDGAAAIRSLGTAIDTTVFNNAGAAIAKTIVDAKGDLIVGTAADTVARLASSASNGDLLTVDTSTASGLKWAAPVGGGKVLQVVSTTKTDTFASTSSNTFLDVTGLSVTITPSSASSTILIITDVNFGTNGLSGYGFIRLLRDSTAICIGDTAGSRTSGSNGSASASADVTFALGLNFKDSPATTSAVTYKIQMFAQNAGQTAYINRSHTDGNGAGGLRGASTITAMEIGA